MFLRRICKEDLIYDYNWPGLKVQAFFVLCALREKEANYLVTIVTFVTFLLSDI